MDKTPWTYCMPKKSFPLTYIDSSVYNLFGVKLLYKTFLFTKRSSTTTYVDNFYTF